MSDFFEHSFLDSYLGEELLNTADVHLSESFLQAVINVQGQEANNQPAQDVAEESYILEPVESDPVLDDHESIKIICIIFTKPGK